VVLLIQRAKYRGLARGIFTKFLKYKRISCNGHFRKIFPIGLKNDVALSLIGGGISLFFMPSMSFIGPGKIGLLVYN